MDKNQISVRRDQVAVDHKTDKMKKVLVLCTGNSCRSQIAHGYLDHFTDDQTKIYSAGVETHGVNPNAVATMKRDGIDISGHTSNHVDEYFDIDFDYVITVCDSAKEKCPVFPTKAYTFHRNFPDPAQFEGNDKERSAHFDEVRDMIRAYCQSFVSAYL